MIILKFCHHLFVFQSIAFKVSYAEDFHSNICEEIVPLQRFNSHQQSASGELLTYKKGVYVLQFDNTFSRFVPSSFSPHRYLVLSITAKTADVTCAAN